LHYDLQKFEEELCMFHDLPKFFDACKQSINHATIEFKKPRGFSWYNLYPQIKATLGVLSALTIIPGLVVECVSPDGYKNTFFGESQIKTNAQKSLDIFKDDLETLIQHRI